MFPDEDGERFCLMCGERTYDWLSTFLDRLLDAMERQALKEQFLVPSCLDSPPPQPSPVEGEGVRLFLSPPPLRGRVREGVAHYDNP